MLRVPLIVLSLLVLTIEARADDIAPPIEATAEEIATLVRDLGHDEFARRRDATTRLIRIGEPAVEAVFEVIESPNPEVRHRAQRIVARLVHRDLLEGFAALGKRPDHLVDVEEGMTLVARIVDPRIRREDIDRQLDDLGEKLRARIVERVGAELQPSEVPPEEHLAALREVLVDGAGLGGNQRFYDDPRNSSIAYVLEEGEGLPILLSHVVMAVARRADVPVRGLASPGHYMCYYDATKQPGGPGGSRIIDPFDGFDVMTAHEARRNGHQFDALSPDRPRSAVLRMLANLANDYEQSGRRDIVSRIRAYQRLLEPAE